MKKSRVVAGALCAAALLIAPLAAVETKTWEQGEQADFEKGTIKRLSLSSDGHLSTAPVTKELFDPGVTFLWAVARDSKGNVYAGGGSLNASKAKLIQVDAAGKAKTLAELDGMAIQAIAIDRQDRVYAATSPDGKVYRVDAAGKAETFYDPKAKYIWAMAFSKNGDLFIGTGDNGEIHKVTANGTGSVFYKTEEAHVRSLAIDANDNIIAGTDPSGLILRVCIPRCTGLIQRVILGVIPGVIRRIGRVLPLRCVRLLLSRRRAGSHASLARCRGWHQAPDRPGHG